MSMPALTKVLRAYVAQNGDGQYSAETVDGMKIVGTPFPTAGAAQRGTDLIVGQHLKWEPQPANTSFGRENWNGYELVSAFPPVS